MRADVIDSTLQGAIAIALEELLREAQKNRVHQQRLDLIRANADKLEAARRTEPAQTAKRRRATEFELAVQQERDSESEEEVEHWGGVAHWGQNQKQPAANLQNRLAAGAAGAAHHRPAPARAHPPPAAQSAGKVSFAAVAASADNRPAAAVPAQLGRQAQPLIAQQGRDEWAGSTSWGVVQPAQKAGAGKAPVVGAPTSQAMPAAAPAGLAPQWEGATPWGEPKVLHTKNETEEVGARAAVAAARPVAAHRQPHQQAVQPQPAENGIQVGLRRGAPPPQAGPSQDSGEAGGGWGGATGWGRGNDVIRNPNYAMQQFKQREPRPHAGSPAENQVETPAPGAAGHVGEHSCPEVDCCRRPK